MPAKQTVIDINEEQFKSILEKVEARIGTKPKQGMTLREAISKFKPTITKALRRGYTYEEVAAILTEEGISIKGATLKQYLAESKGKKRAPETASKLSNQTAEESALSDIKPDTKLELDTSLDIEADTKAETKSDIKPDTKSAAKHKSVVRGKFADIPSNDEL